VKFFKKLSFQSSTLPGTHQFMQDNDSKHTSHAAQDFYARSGINWWRTLAESPDMNPIENFYGIHTKRSQAKK